MAFIYTVCLSVQKMNGYAVSFYISPVADGRTLLRKGRRVRFFERDSGFHRQKMVNIKRRNQHELAIARKAASLAD